MSKILTFGVFDYFHLGHLRLFKQAKKHADYLIVAVMNSEYVKNIKPNSQILYSTDEKVEMLNSIKEIDKVIVYNELNRKTLSKIDFDILALGEDHHAERHNDAIAWCKENNKKVVRLKRTPNICSSNIKTEVFKSFDNP